ncbi:MULTISPECIES: GNAT family N-acetyltransferase [unclassified Rhizobium]|uniref:GNAT family N-acetyltransferase n=1 Tax=unclassified Rhizobium TaxID=2613769 RepID=UPI0007147FF9|nr:MULTISPECIES: GNAT family N-acetyltransferase [unclassified Rhizobium]KQS88336.1 acetyltransferase [Rhizobium sp. Leaf391]KQT03927.1 acetyltransferase [Rhizobium sp. Leaf386]KQT95611.1 acetyltransferase [Rhizobium sp. Leaf453]
MTTALSLRAAEPRDAADLAILVDLASHGFATWLWYGAVMRGEADTALEQGRARMLMDDEPGAWKDATVAEWNGEIAGASIGYELDESVRDMVPAHPVIKPLLDLQVEVIGSRFIDSLCVYRHHRRKGIGQALLALEMVKARGGRVSLITESHNETALSLYAASGFAEKARLPAVPLFEDSKRHEWVLLARNMS